WAVTSDGAAVHGAGELTLPDPSPEWGVFEEHLYTLAGRWACVIFAQQPRLYLDAGGSLAAVFDTEAPRVASTTSLLRWENSYTLSDERVEPGAVKPNQFFP